MRRRLGVNPTHSCPYLAGIELAARVDGEKAKINPTICRGRRSTEPLQVAENRGRDLLRNPECGAVFVPGNLVYNLCSSHIKAKYLALPILSQSPLHSTEVFCRPPVGCFGLRLYCWKERIAVPRPGTPTQSNEQNISLLVVDDNYSVCNCLEWTLEVFDGLQVVGTAENGQEAARLCDELQPDVILMDMMMPVMDGMTATRLIKQRCPEIQIIALSNRMGNEYEREALEAGVFRCVSKTVSVQELVDVIRAAKARSVSLNV